MDETGTTFEANAVKKAIETARATGHTVFADDSGLEVFSLSGEPGVRSARYAGPDATDMDRMLKLLDELDGFPDRDARFVCVIAVAEPDGIVSTAEGEVRGRIAAAPRGYKGFGYDPIFIPDGQQRTFAEMDAVEKDSMSHRRNALNKAIADGLFE